MSDPNITLKQCWSTISQPLLLDLMEDNDLLHESKKVWTKNKHQTEKSSL